jgi:dihydropteroate synthase
VTRVVPTSPGNGGDATPSFALPDGARSGLPESLGETQIGSRVFRWGERTFVMGIINVTPDSFSGDGVLARGGDAITRSVEQAHAMAEEGADIVDVGGESTRPGHAEVDETEELRRVVPVIEAIRAALPDVPISVDTTKATVAEAALDAGADLINDVWGVARDDELPRVAARRNVPIVLMHNRAQANYTNLMAEVVAELQGAIARALDAGVAWESIVIDPGFGFGKTPEHNLAVLRDVCALTILGRPILLGTSRKSTLGKVLDLPPDERLEATLATTALAVAAGVDIVRVHDVRANVRAARLTDAVVRA